MSLLRIGSTRSCKSFVLSHLFIGVIKSLMKTILLILQSLNRPMTQWRNSSISAFASCRSFVSKPSVNQLYTSDNSL
jgi:hypothetical protein